MKKTGYILLSIISFVFTAYNETIINGDISDRTFDKSKSPYIISEDVFVSEGHSVTIKEGVVFLFKSFTGLNVYGGISVEGTDNNPVIFTSVNDGTYNNNAAQLPQTFDWNGILIDKKAEKVNFRNFRVCYSVFGIKSKIERILLINGIFKENGQFNFTINDEVQMVSDKVSYSYGHQSLQGQTPGSLSTNDSASSAGGETIKVNLDANENKKKPPSKLTVPIKATLVAGIVLGLGSPVFGLISHHYRLAYEEPPTADKPWNQKERDTDKQNFHVWRGVSVASGVASGASLAVCAALGIVKRNRLKNKNGISLLLDVNPNNYMMRIAGEF